MWLFISLASLLAFAESIQIYNPPEQHQDHMNHQQNIYYGAQPQGFTANQGHQIVGHQIHQISHQASDHEDQKIQDFDNYGYHSTQDKPRQNYEDQHIQYQDHEIQQGPGDFQGNADADNGQGSFGVQEKGLGEKTSRIMNYQSESDGKNYQYAYETDNGIKAEELGTQSGGSSVQGAYSYTGDDGQVYTVNYVADENGYRAMGAHLPTPPPVPEEILRSLEMNAQDEARGIYDDGEYTEPHHQTETLPSHENQHQNIEHGYQSNHEDGHQSNQFTESHGAQ